MNTFSLNPLKWVIRICYCCDCSVPVSTQMVMNGETILVGMTVAALTFPLQTIVRFLFQKTQSKVYMPVYIIPCEIILF